jgi:hypothetical protein
MCRTCRLLLFSVVALFLASCGRSTTGNVNPAKVVKTQAKEHRVPRSVDDPPDASMEDLSEWLSVGDIVVENGSVYEKAIVELDRYHSVAVPEDAIIRREGEVGKLKLYMKKTLAFHGHPGEPMSIRLGRKNMGCAVKEEGDTLVVATYGEWKSKEGGARMRLICIVPAGFAVEQRSKLSGEESAGHDRDWFQKPAAEPRPKEAGKWYGLFMPAEGWKAVPSTADLEKTN